MMPVLRCFAVLFLAAVIPSAVAHATEAKIDAETCVQLRAEQVKFRKSGILDDVKKGAAWARSNLAQERLREVELYIQLDEQLKFGCRDAKRSPEAEKASAAAARLELNSDADPLVPVAVDPAKPGAAKTVEKEKKATKAHAKPKKATSGNSDSGSTDPAKPAPATKPHAEVQPAPARSKRVPSAAAATKSEEPVELPAFGFGEMTVLPHTETGP